MKKYLVLLLVLLLSTYIMGCSSSSVVEEGEDGAVEEGAEGADTDAVAEDDEAGIDGEGDGEVGDDAAIDEEVPGDMSSAEMPSGGAEDMPPPMDAPMGGGGMQSYTVNAGDTLMKIAWNIYGDIDRWKDIQTLNNISNPNQLSPGQSIQYEAPAESFMPDTSGESYRIIWGDSLVKISTKLYGTPNKWRKIYNKNSRMIKNPDLIYAGFTVYYNISPDELAQAASYSASMPAASPSMPQSAPSAPVSNGPPPKNGGVSVLPMGNNVRLGVGGG